MGKIEKTKKEAVEMTKKYVAETNVGTYKKMGPTEEIRWGEIVKKVKEVKGLFDRLEIWEAVKTAFRKERKGGTLCFNPPMVEGIFLTEEDTENLQSWWSGLRGWQCRYSGAKFPCFARCCDNRARPEYVSEEIYERFPQICSELYLQTRKKAKRHIVTASCVDEGCDCIDKDGIILYDGDDPDEAERSKSTAPRDYEVKHEIL